MIWWGVKNVENKFAQANEYFSSILFIFYYILFFRWMSRRLWSHEFRSFTHALINSLLGRLIKDLHTETTLVRSIVAFAFSLDIIRTLYNIGAIFSFDFETQVVIKTCWDISWNIKIAKNNFHRCFEFGVSYRYYFYFRLWRIVPRTCMKDFKWR